MSRKKSKVDWQNSWLMKWKNYCPSQFQKGPKDSSEVKKVIIRKAVHTSSSHEAVKRWKHVNHDVE